MGRITGVRGDTVIREPDMVDSHPGTSEEHAQEILANELINLAAKTFDTSRPVDEYQSVSSATTLEVLPEYEMDELIESIVVVANPFVSGPVPSQPAIPASTVAQQNVNTYPVTVVISAGAITAVVVNGITVGTAAGTYTVPASGSISITYSVAPTWVWSNGGGLYVPNVITLQLGRRSWAFSMSGAGFIQLDGLALRLNRNERRVATQVVAGPLSLELTGHADMSGT